MITDVTIISTNLSRNILKRYSNYQVFDKSFTYDELLKYKCVLFFNILAGLNDSDIKKLYEFLRDNKINFINVTNNMEEIRFTEKLIIYDNDVVVAEGKTLELIKNEKLFKRLGFKLPFIVELSLLLKDYGLVDKIYEDYSDLVGDLWK